jgi:hypothetical protein
MMRKARKGSAAEKAERRDSVILRGIPGELPDVSDRRHGNRDLDEHALEKNG